jgi:hypothetical protein
MFFYDAQVSFEQSDVCGLVEVRFFKGGQLDPLTVYLFVSRDMYTEKTAQRVMIYVPPSFRVPAAKSSPRVAECRLQNVPPWVAECRMLKVHKREIFRT